MRRKDKEITDKAVIENILKEAEVIRIAMVDDGEPYLVAMNYTYQDGAIYMHSALEGRKIDILRKNSRVAFQADTNVGLALSPEAHECTTRYKSVFGTGKAVLIDDHEAKVKALDAIMFKHTGHHGHHYPENVLNKTLAIRIDIDSITGKKSGPES
jgi:hypothetical protein